MFLKPFRVKTQTAIKGSDRKKLRAEIQKHLNVDGESLTLLVPNKEEMTVMKLQTHSDDVITVYNLSGNPIFFEANDILYPTVYTLWKFPQMLPVFTTWPPVFKKILSGADLMLPGVISNVPVTPTFMNRIKKGTRCSVKLLGNKSPVAVGTTAMSGEDMYGSAMRGKGVLIVHSYTDQLWALGNKSAPPQVDDPEMLSAVQSSTDLEVDDPDATEIQFVKSELLESPADDTSTEQATAAIANLDVNDAEAEQDDNDEDDPRSLQEKMDELLTWCFMCAIKSRVKQSDLPLLTSTFFRNYLQPLCPQGQQVDVKKSSYKKLTKFLKVMQDRGYVKVKEMTKGVESIISIEKSHPDLRSITVPELPDDSPSQKQADSVSTEFSPPQIQELFTVTSASLLFFKLYNYSKGSALSTLEIRNLLTQYVKENDLQREENQGKVTLDPILSDLLLQRGEYIEVLGWEEMMSRVECKMNHAYRITSANQPGVVKKGKLEPITFITEKRGGNKTVTLVHNLEVYGIDVHEFAHSVQIGVACSASVSERPGKTQNMEVLIQGNQINFIANALLEKYKIPRKYISGMEKAPKAKKKR